MSKHLFYFILYLNINIKKTTTDNLNIDINVVTLGAFKNVTFLRTGFDLDSQGIGGDTQKSSSCH